MREHFAAHPDDVTEGVMLCEAQIAAGNTAEALATIGRIEGLKDCPTYIFYLKAQLCLQQQQWEESWNAVRRYADL
mgnify:CR=1 FL=1